MGTYSARAPRPQAQRRSARQRAAGSGGPLRRLPWGLATAAAGVAVWLIADPRTPDLAAQVYRANLFSEVGFAVWDTRWYAGHHLPGYSLLFPPLAALLGVRAVGALCGARLGRAVRARWRARRTGRRRAGARCGSRWPPSGTCGADGSRSRSGSASRWGRCSRRCAAARPRRSRWRRCARPPAPWRGCCWRWRGSRTRSCARSSRRSLVLGAPAAVVVWALAGLFPEGGWEPYPLLSFLATAAIVAGFLWVAPPEQRLLRAGATVYLAACATCVRGAQPDGQPTSSATGCCWRGRCSLCAVGLRAPASRGSRRCSAAIARVDRLGPGARDGGGRGRRLDERLLLRAGRALPRGTRGDAGAGRGAVHARALGGRVLAPRVSLARGWEKQLDERYDGVLLARGLTARGYQRWLRAQAVGYVALPDTPLDPSSAAEGRLIRAGLPYLREGVRDPPLADLRGARPDAARAGARAR